MGGRPEEDARGYDITPAQDGDMWEPFTPWLPGDPSTSADAHERRHTEGAARTGDRGRVADLDEGREAIERLRRPRKDEQEAPQRRGRWWTEDVSRRFASGDRVRNRGPVGGAAFSHVPDHTRGRVVSTREGLLGDDFAVVEFDNGYTEEVRAERLERRGWLD
jgi:hypothetical protein